MPVTIKSAGQIERMRKAGRFLAQMHEELHKSLRPGMSTRAIDTLGESIIRDFGCIPNFKNYNGFPASICVSVNNEVVHGIPSDNHFFREGDIVSLDAGLIYDGMHADAARTWGIGEISDEAQRLITVTRQSFYAGIRLAREGNYLYQISAAIQKHAEDNGFSIVRELAGHGIGTKLHEDPQIPNYRRLGRGIRLQAGMTLAIEPMVNAGGHEIRWLDDGWTVVTADGSLSAHYENTILITKDGCEVLTRLSQEEI